MIKNYTEWLNESHEPEMTYHTADVILKADIESTPNYSYEERPVSLKRNQDFETGYKIIKDDSKTPLTEILFFWDQEDLDMDVLKQLFGNEIIKSYYIDLKGTHLWDSEYNKGAWIEKDDFNGCEIYAWVRTTDDSGTFIFVTITNLFNYIVKNKIFEVISEKEGWIEISLGSGSYHFTVSKK